MFLRDFSRDTFASLTPQGFRLPGYRCPSHLRQAFLAQNGTNSIVRYSHLSISMQKTVRLLPPLNLPHLLSDFT